MDADTSGLSVLVLVDAALGPEQAGPATRGWELARVLAARHRVTVAARGAAPGERDGIALVPYARSALVAAARGRDAVVATWLPPYLLAALARSRALRVADLYDPLEHELAAVPGAGGDAAVRRLTALQLRHADLVACAAEPQARDLRVRLGERARSVPVITVPFGVPEPAPAPPAGLLRARFEGIAQDDVIVLWWGSIWPWLDAATAIEAVARLTKDRPDVKLVFASGAPAAGPPWAREAREAARRLAADRGLLGRSVLFWEDWVPFAERDRLVGEADLGLVLAAPSPEAALAARARFADYLWCGVPCVLSSGDEMAARLAEAGFARTVPPGDPAAAAAALRELLEPAARERARAAAKELASRLSWPTVAEPLVAAIEREAANRRDRRFVPVLRDAAAYYAARAIGR